MFTTTRVFIRQNLSWLVPATLFLVAALTYLPLVSGMGYTHDDWYLIYDAHSQGAAFFHQIYSIDRPARGYVMEFFYTIFGDQVFFYHLSAWFFRALSAAALYWSLTRVWPRREAVGFVTAVLFLLYPGFLAQTNPIDYQSQILSLCLAMLSIACTVRALQPQGLAARIIFGLLSIVLGLAYLPLVEYFIGLEALRLAFILQNSLTRPPAPLKELLSRALRAWLPFAVIPAVFLVWRLFIFQAERRATDAGLQLGLLFSSPLTGLGWLLALAQDGLKAVFLAWGVPFYNLALNMRLRDTLAGLALAAVVTVVVLALTNAARTGSAPGLARKTQPLDGADWRMHFILAGAAVVLAGLLPVILVNRRADFGDYSRYMLASAAGAAMLVTGLLWLLEDRRVQTALLALLVLSAVLTHYANAVNAVQETRSVRNFWWQVSWRAPAIHEGVTLLASYPAAVIQEDYFIWGPANLIYQAEKQDNLPIQIKIPAAVLTDDTLLQVLAGRGKETQLRRGNNVQRDFSEVLVLAQASASGCVRAIDGSAPELSAQDEQRILLAAPASQIGSLLVHVSPVAPPDMLGPEPAHDWCYYYEKAALARQQGDWPAVAALGEKALAEGFYPSDRVEWLPFLQAYTALGQPDKLRRFASIMRENAFIQDQACALLTKTASMPDMQIYIRDNFCK